VSLLVVHLLGEPTDLDAQEVSGQLRGTIQTKFLDAIFSHFAPT
jgi:hypothetical protein